MVANKINNAVTLKILNVTELDSLRHCFVEGSENGVEEELKIRKFFNIL